MKLKTLIVVVAVLAVLSAAVFFAQRPTAAPSSDPRLKEPLVDASTVERAKKITLSDQGKTVILQEGADKAWVVTSYHDLPADFQKLSSFVGELTSAKVEQFVTARPEKLTRLEFKDTKIQLLDGTEQPLLDFTLGKTADAGGRFVRFGQEEKGYRATLNAWLDAESKNWADARLVRLAADDIARVELTFPNANPVVATRTKKDEPFTSENAPEGQRLNTGKITSALATLTGLRFTETRDPNDPAALEAKAHTRTAKLTTFEGKTLTVQLGRKPEQKIVKPPAPKTDGSTGPAALGSVADLAKTDDATRASDGKDSTAASKTPPAEASKPLEPEIETIPAGPVFAFVSHSDSDAPVNAMMRRRSFEVGEWSFTSLPQKADELFEPAPKPEPATTPAAPTASTETPAATGTQP